MNSTEQWDKNERNAREDLRIEPFVGTEREWRLFVEAYKSGYHAACRRMERKKGSDRE